MEHIAHREWRQRSGVQERLNEKSFSWNKAHPQRVKEIYLKYRFGLEYGEYDVMLENQVGVCAICGNPETCKDSRNATQIRALAVDHDHETGKVRGLLCHACNRGIGSLKDDPVLLQKAIEYLQGGVSL
jgi:hypothetical protein